jgi:serine/threonine protein kinase
MNLAIPKKSLEVTLAQLSHAGVKTQNEDSIGIRQPNGYLQSTKGIAAVIADGVSASEGGKEASEICVQGFLNDYFSTPDSWSVKKSGGVVFNALNRWLYSRGMQYTKNTQGYVSTMSAIVLKSRSAYIFHVGDTRIYRVRNNSIEQLTKDHAVAVGDGQTYLTRAMGLDTRLDIDYQCIDIEQGDLFFLSSDGIHDVISLIELTALITNQKNSLDQRCQQLHQLAIDKHSSDNLSCQLIHVDTLPISTKDEFCRQLTQLPFPPLLSPGQRLDNYLIEKELHSSNRSQVYLVKDTDNRHLIMKTPSPNFSDDAAYIERFVLESWIGDRVSSSNVVKIHQTNQPPNALYYLTEYINGITLSQWMKENPRPAVNDVISLISQISKGIRALHRKDIIHQDIKPDNIIIDSNGVPKIIDFGSCLARGIYEISVPVERELVLGTADYSAPEHTLHRPINNQSDLYSLALITYEALAGKPAFKGSLAHSNTVKDFLALEYKTSYDYNPLIPHWVDGAIKKALHFRPELRYTELDEFIFDLQNPNKEFANPIQKPLVERATVKFWKIACAALLLSHLLWFI